MTARYARIAFTEAVRARQEQAGSRASYAHLDGDQADLPDRLGEREREFIAARDSFYMASVNSDGWPYLQHRGGPCGFLKVPDAGTLAFADFAGNRQYVSVGNIDGDGRVSLFLMDYPARRRLKIMGRARFIDPGAGAFPDLIDPGDYDAPVERACVIEVAACDWNCSKFITPRLTEEEMAPSFRRLVARIRELEDALELASVPPAP